MLVHLYRCPCPSQRHCEEMVERRKMKVPDTIRVTDAGGELPPPPPPPPLLPMFASIDNVLYPLPGLHKRG